MDRHHLHHRRGRAQCSAAHGGIRAQANDYKLIVLLSDQELKQPAAPAAPAA
jgi:hypothetical protein